MQLTTIALLLVETYRTVITIENPGCDATRMFPRVSISQSSRHSIDQLLLWEAFVTHAMDTECAAEYLLIHLFDAATLQEFSVLTVIEVRGRISDVLNSVDRPRMDMAFADVSKQVLMHLLLPLRNKGQTPKTSIVSGTSRASSQKTLCIARDGLRCPVSGRYSEDIPIDEIPSDVRSLWKLSLAHIIPFSSRDNNKVHEMMHRFSGHLVELGYTQGSEINRPRNGMVLEINVHNQFDSFKWGIVASPDPLSDHKYIYRAVQICNDARQLSFDLPSTPILFGLEDDNIELPCPILCNFHVSIGRILHMSGAAEVIDSFYKEEDEFNACGSWLDGSELAWASLSLSLEVITSP